jgi:hypothetical protein
MFMVISRASAMAAAPALQRERAGAEPRVEARDHFERPADRLQALGPQRRRRSRTCVDVDDDPGLVDGPRQQVVRGGRADLRDDAERPRFAADRAHGPVDVGHAVAGQRRLGIAPLR